MTAIAGVWRFDGRPEAEASCGKMLAAQHLYGSNIVSQWADNEVALGRRLMRLLPEDQFDRQPLATERLVLVADVRLDNRYELSGELGLRQEEAKSLSDAAILLRAIERWSDRCLEHLIGDFAFALWDKLERKLKLVRDQLGQRPLHYHRGQRFFAFASMPKGLHALGEIPYRPDMERIAETLSLMPETGRRSFFEGIECVEAGHVVTVSHDGFSTQRYWRPTRRSLRFRNPDDYSEALRALLDEAVRCRLRSTGVVATHLSGGLDSGAVTATAARLLAQSGQRLLAFTAVPREGYGSSAPPDRIIDEGPLAALTASHYQNIDHVLVPNEGRSPLADLDRNFYSYDRPLDGISGAGWGYSLDRALAKRNVRVVLTGELGNITLSYDGMELLSELFASGHWLHLAREWRALVSRGMHLRGPLRFILAPRISPELWVWLHRITNRNVLQLHDYSAISPSRFSKLRTGTYDFSYRPSRNGFEHRVAALRRIDPGNFRKGGLGVLGVDVRDPTADIRLVEFCLAVPTDQYLQNGIPRALARRALSDRLPKAVLEERRRVVSVADWHEDLDRARCDVARELESIDACEKAREVIDTPRLRDLVRDWPSDQRWHEEGITTAYRYALQRAIAVGHFIRRATQSNQ